MTVTTRLWEAFYQFGRRFGLAERKRGRWAENCLLAIAAMLTLMWIIGLLRAPGANIPDLPIAASIITSLWSGGLFLRHVRLRVAQDSRYIFKKRTGQNG